MSAPHCGYPAIPQADGFGFECGSSAAWSSPECRERAAHQKTEAELQEARRFDIRKFVPTTYGDAQATGWITRDDCAGHEWDNRTSVENLAWTIQRASETRRKLEEAAGLISKLMPYLMHKGPKCYVVCECGLNVIIMEAGKRAGVVKAAEAEKGGASEVVHGQTCQKVVHKGQGYMHPASDDRRPGPSFSSTPPRSRTG